MSKSIKIDIAGKSTELPIAAREGGKECAVFSLHGNQALTEYCAEKLLPLVKGCDVVLTSEESGLELAHCIARGLKQSRYAVARRTQKLYILEGIAISIRSKLNNKLQNYRLSSFDQALVRGKKVAIVDVAIDSGGMLEGLETLAERAGAKVVARVFVLANAKTKAARQDVASLADLPIIE